MQRSKKNCLQGSVCGLVLFLSAITFSGCVPILEETDQDTNIITIVTFREPIKASEVFTLLSGNDTNPSVRVFTQYGEISSSWSITEGTQGEQFDELMDRYIERLEFLLQSFDFDDILERPVYNQLSIILSQIENDNDINITRIVVNGGIPESLNSHTLVDNAYERENIEEVREVDGVVNNNGVQREAIEYEYDYDNDGYHVPVGGTVTFWDDGILVKFWFDALATSYYSSANTVAYYNYNLAPAFEVDSMFRGETSEEDVVSCGSDSLNEISNLSGRYIDTEICDSGNWRVCSVGTQSVTNLQTWYLYWTWRSLDNLDTDDDPELLLNLQPSERCWWCSVQDYYQYPAMCTCAVGFSSSPSSLYNNNSQPWIQSIVHYYYNDAPGEELEWYRD